MTQRVPRRKVGHPPHGVPECAGDSYRGIRFAVEEGCRWADLNFLKTGDGRIVCTHWPRILAHDFYDPTAQYGTSVQVSELTWPEIRRFRSRRGEPPYRVRLAEDIIPAALARGVGVEFESKTSRFTVADYEHVRDIAETAASPLRHNLRHRLQVKTMFTLPPEPWQRLERAKAAGHTTIALCHERGLTAPRSARPSIDYFRGFPLTYV